MEQMRSSWITEFMIFLEKYIYNAAEGTATVLPAVSKPVKTFFHTNWSTCREWLTRVRPAALAVSLHAGHFGAAIYHASLMLQAAANSKTNIDIEAITMTIARALIKIEEPEVLHGFYVWIKKTFDKKLVWLKGAAEQANSRHELALGFFKKLKNIKPNDAQQETMITSLYNDSRCLKFIDEQIIESYKHIQSWEEIEEWKDIDQQNPNSQWYCLSALKMFEEDAQIPEKTL